MGSLSPTKHPEILYVTLRTQTEKMTNKRRGKRVKTKTQKPAYHRKIVTRILKAYPDTVFVFFSNESAIFLMLFPKVSEYFPYSQNSKAVALKIYMNIRLHCQ